VLREPRGHDDAPWSADNSVYALGRDDQEARRLEQQSEELASQTAALRDRAGSLTGAVAVDVGCGPSGGLAVLATKVGPSGRVVGVDNSPMHVRLAQEYAAGRGFANVEVIQADATATGLPEGVSDIAHARAMLVNVPDAPAVLAEMVRLTKPGGYVLVQEPDPSARICYPAIPEWDRLGHVYRLVFERHGADLFIGRRLPTLMRESGLVEIGVEVRADVYPAGHSRRTIFPDLARSLRSTIVAEGVLDESEFDQLDGAIRGHLDDPNVLVMPHLFFLVWGRRPNEVRRSSTA
jgi:SAM-dependent methyltransferase